MSSRGGAPNRPVHCPVPDEVDIGRKPVLLYFAYTARIEPSKMAEVSPGAAFEFIAHLSDWTLEFPISGNGWNGGLPSVRPNEGDTVWGAVFTVPEDEALALDSVESA